MFYVCQMNIHACSSALHVRTTPVSGSRTMQECRIQLMKTVQRKTSYRATQHKDSSGLHQCVYQKLSGAPICRFKHALEERRVQYLHFGRTNAAQQYVLV